MAAMNHYYVVSRCYELLLHSLLIYPVKNQLMHVSRSMLFYVVYRRLPDQYLMGRSGRMSCGQNSHSQIFLSRTAYICMGETFLEKGCFCNIIKCCSFLPLQDCDISLYILSDGLLDDGSIWEETIATGIYQHCLFYIMRTSKEPASFYFLNIAVTMINIQSSQI